MCDRTAPVIKANNYTPPVYTHARSYPTTKWTLEQESKKDEDELLQERSHVTMDHSQLIVHKGHRIVKHAISCLATSTTEIYQQTCQINIL